MKKIILVVTIGFFFLGVANAQQRSSQITGWVFDTLNPYSSDDESNPEKILAGYKKAAEIIESVLETDEPEQVANRHMSEGKFGLIAAYPFGVVHFPGISCAVAFPESTDLIAAGFDYSDYIIGDEQTRLTSSLYTYSSRYNQAIIKSSATPFFDVCRVAKEGDEPAAIGRPYRIVPPAPDKEKYDRSNPDIPASSQPDMGTPKNLTLHQAARFGNIKRIKTFLKSGVNIDSIDGFGMTALAWASARGRNHVVRFLVNQGADINLPSGVADRTPITWSIISDDYNTVKSLANSNADLNRFSTRRNRYGGVIERPISIAALKGNLKVIELLLRKGAKPEEFMEQEEISALGYAVMSQKADVVRTFLQAGSNPNAVNWSRDEHEGEAPLGIAAKFGLIEIASILLENGADIDLVNFVGGSSALELSLEQNQFDMAHFLLDQGANPNVGRRERALSLSSGDSEAPLLAAVSLGQNLGDGPDKVLRRLINLKADLNETSDYMNQTAASFAAEWEKVSALKLLLDAGANPNIPRKDGKSALQAALTGCDEEDPILVKMLLSAGADPKHADYTGRQVFHENCAHTVGAALLVAGADINAQDRHGRTPLMHALATEYDLETPPTDASPQKYLDRHLGKLKFLIENGSNWSLQDQWGMTAWDYAEYYELDAALTAVFGVQKP
ncbi:MAG: hypothetical protein DHS20C05_12110 [Hyphococcus sp.]|nr:MAG: hypothetical protein DHS20C05_12110 [Marinicaulis sp.]